MNTRYPVLDLLADGHFHSGEELGLTLGLTRAAVWKQLQGLRQQGLSISSIPGKGYRLAGDTELLAVESIIAQLSESHRALLEPIEVFHRIDSTNAYLLSQPLPSYGLGRLCLAEQQTAGLGRRGRTWHSPFARNLYFSLAWQFDSGAETLGGLSLALGVALVRSLRRLGVKDAGLKWPNDIHCTRGKLAGILVELCGDLADASCAVIGVGVNVGMAADASLHIDQPWSDLTQCLGRAVSRNRLAAAVITDLLIMLGEFREQGLAGLMNEWCSCDLTHGRQIDLHLPREHVSGTACGIDESGALLVNVDGRVQRFTSGEVSLRITQ